MDESKIEPTDKIRAHPTDESKTHIPMNVAAKSTTMLPHHAKGHMPALSTGTHKQAYNPSELPPLPRVKHHQE